MILLEPRTNKTSTPKSHRRSTFQVSRRAFIKAGAVGAAAGSLLADVPKALASRKSPSTHGRRRGRTRSVGADPALLALINRATFGYSRAVYDEAESLGYDEFLEQQLDPESIDDSAWESQLAGLHYDTLNMTSAQIYANYSMMNQATPIIDLVGATMFRAAFSKKQLHERMVEFWTDHFNIDIRDGHCQWLKTADDRDVIRQHALGLFPDLLRASAHSPAMLFYLDNYANQVGHAQENYAREVMELHTMGVDGGYTQADVEEVARCFTGWTIYGPDSGMYGQYTFYTPYHDYGAKTFLGQTIPAGGGESDGLTILDILANHPSTARFIAKKLCQKFLAYDPPEDIVQAVAATYQATGGDIKAMLRVILNRDVLLHLAGPKLKRPFHLIASLLRATDAEVNNRRYIEGPLVTMDHVPFYWPRPDGYPDAIESWGSALLPRWTFAAEFVLQNPFVVFVDYDALLQSEGGNVPGQQAAAIDRVLTGGAMTDEEVAAIQDFYDTAPGATNLKLRDAFSLGATVPTFQLV